MTKNIFFLFFSWYFIEEPREIFRIWKNFLKFNLEYFSIVLLLKTFLAPWRRYKMSYGRGFDISRYLESFFSNLIFRMLGMVVRTVLILLGLLSQIFIIFLGIIVFIWWFFLPLFLILGLYYGFKILL